MNKTGLGTDFGPPNTPMEGRLCGCFDVHKRASYAIIDDRRLITMTERQAINFGQMIKDRRKQLGLERLATAETAGMNVASLYRIEHGHILNPDPQKLEALAKVLRLKLADVLAAAGYPMTRALPEPGPYLRAKFRDLPPRELEKLSREVSDVLKRYGVAGTSGPAAGEDEAEEAGTASGGQP